MKPISKIIAIIAIGLILFSIALWLENSISSNNSESIKLGKLSFHTSIDHAIKEAKNQSKPLFVYFRSETCYWCIIFEEEALSDEIIVDFLNNKFILISIDTIKQKNAALNLNVRTTPYIIFFNTDGKEISRIPGYIQKDEFLIKLNSIFE